MGRTLLLALLAVPALAAAETHVVTIEGMVFPQPTLTVKRGDTVTWRNKDLVPHTVTAKGRFDSGEIAAGRSWSWVATAPGTYEYVCAYHPGMRAAIVVQ
jgi:plastocyanin